MDLTWPGIALIVGCLIGRVMSGKFDYNIQPRGRVADIVFHVSGLLLILGSKYYWFGGY
jgi:hypothetical protein